MNETDEKLKYEILNEIFKRNKLNQPIHIDDVPSLLPNRDAVQYRTKQLCRDMFLIDKDKTGYLELSEFGVARLEEWKVRAELALYHRNLDYGTLVAVTVGSLSSLITLVITLLQATKC